MISYFVCHFANINIYSDKMKGIVDNLQNENNLLKQENEMLVQMYQSTQNSNDIDNDKIIFESELNSLKPILDQYEDSKTKNNNIDSIETSMQLVTQIKSLQDKVLLQKKDIQVEYVCTFNIR